MEAKRVASQSSIHSSHITIVLLAFLLFIARVQSSSPTKTRSSSITKTYHNYLKTACKATTYPLLCYHSLSSYVYTIKTNDLELCNTALTISLKAATNTSRSVTKLSKQKGLSRDETNTVKVCLDQIGDSIYELRQSLETMGNLKGNNFGFQMANVKTWVSAAITDDATCTDGFDGRKVNPTVKKRISNRISKVTKLTSNALALINHMKYQK